LDKKKEEGRKKEERKKEEERRKKKEERSGCYIFCEDNKCGFLLVRRLPECFSRTTSSKSS